MRGAATAVEPKIVVQNKEGCFLQTMNAGCGCVFLFIALLFVAAIVGGAG
jgi:uncharacterized membrane protein